MTQSTTETITFYLEKILQSVHPMMAEAIYLASVPQWYDLALFSAIRDVDDGRNEGLIERLTRYSFIMRWDDEAAGSATYAMRPEERRLTQRYWIMKDPDAYRAAHRRALSYWQDHPDPNDFAQAQNLLYHQLFVDQNAATDWLVNRFRAYYNDRQLVAIERLLDTADEARFYLTLLQEPISDLEILLTHLRARLAQLRGDWAESQKNLEALRQKTDLPPQLQPYITRAYGHILAHNGDFVGAIAEYERALTQFQEQATAVTPNSFTNAATLQADQAQTMIALGDAYVGLATAVRGPTETDNEMMVRLRPLRTLLNFIISLPLVIYLSMYLGWRVWRPEFWPTLQGLDWIVARLFAIGARYYHRADPLLEQYGDPGEGVAADEKLAYLYLALGDARLAQTQFDRLLQESEAPLGEYRQAAVRVGLGQAWLRQEQPLLAREQLEKALPILQQYEDKPLEATCRAALAEALFITEPEQAIAQFDQSAHIAAAQDDWTAATNTLERMAALGATHGMTEPVQQQATAVAQNLPQRHYTARFRHPALVYFQRLTLLLLPLVLLLMPMLVIRLDSRSTLTPTIQFKAAPIFNPAQVVSSQLSQGVTTANVVSASDASVIIWLAVALLVIYIVLSVGLGLLLIVVTPLRTVQERGQSAAVRLDESGINLGTGSHVAWDAVTELVTGDVQLWQRPLPHESAFALVTPTQRLIIRGSTNWYTALRQRVSVHLPAATPVTNCDTTILNSRLGRFYIVNVVLLALVTLLAWFAPQPLWWDIPGLPYSLADLYPFFYLGLVALPMWWVVIRPLQTQMHLEPDSRLPWWLLGGGLLLALFQGVTLFRPLLTAVNLYPPLVALILLAGSGWAVWRVRERGAPVYDAKVRWGTAVVVALVGLLMGLLLLRETAAYHYLVLGNARRDRAQLVTDAAEKEALLAGAVNAYSQSIKIGATRLLGIDVRAATRIPLGIPEPQSFTWLAALNNRAALQVQLGQYPEAIGSYNVIIDYTDRPADVYAWRAIARQSWSTVDTGEGELTMVKNQYELALGDFAQAIELAPRRTEFYLWRAVANQALDNLAAAETDYLWALAQTEPPAIPLTPQQQERALTGMGWIRYKQEDFVAAKLFFEQAVQANPEEAEAWVGLGYADYSLGLYDEKAVAWERAYELAPDDPTVLISLGTLHWKLGGRTDDASAKCLEYSTSADYFARSTAQPGQDAKSVAFTFRTLGQVQSLLKGCPDFTDPHPYQLTVNSYTEAIRLDPENIDYYQKRGRWEYALWLQLADTPENEHLLYDALADLTAAFKGGYRDNTTLTFLRNVLATLEPRALAKASDAMATGDFAAALNEYSVLAEAQPDKASIQFQAGLAALGLEDESAVNWFEQGIATAVAAPNATQLLTQALTNLDAFLAAHPNVDGRTLREKLNAAILSSQANDPDRAFADGLAALAAGNQTEADALYQRGLTLAAEKRYVTAVKTAVFALLAYPPNQIEPILSLVRKQMGVLTAVTTDETDTAAAFDLAYVAVVAQDWPTAGQWYNEAIRRTAVNNQYPILRASRADFYQLWGITGVTSDQILTAMEAALPEQLAAYPDLNNAQLYWRFRAWFKYGLGLSAYRLDADSAAAAALKSGQADADIAFSLHPDNAYVQSYLTEGAWGWFNISRGDDAYAASDYETALTYYELAAQSYKPERNNDAKAEAILAAFKAGAAAVQVTAFDQAADWYKEGVQLAQLYNRPDDIATARSVLTQIRGSHPAWGDEIGNLLELLPE
ncbi:MAG: hypothetical protein H6667_05520 [Ardenticatenaceae bacterium]|nr:hypothetical protein [Ardenticatenaceae bacterium]MCB9444641.1 hypothetical protein [Ardenticatenaceae bacterium]